MGRLGSNIAYFTSCAAAVASFALVKKYRGIQPSISNSQIAALSLSAIALQVTTDPKCLRDEFNKKTIIVTLLPSVATTGALLAFEKATLKASLVSGLFFGVSLSAIKYIVDRWTHANVDHYSEALSLNPNDINNWKALEQAMSSHLTTTIHDKRYSSSDCKKEIQILSAVSEVAQWPQNLEKWKQLEAVIPDDRTFMVDNKPITKADCKFKINALQLPLLERQLPNHLIHSQIWDDIASCMPADKTIRIDGTQFTPEKFRRQAKIQKLAPNLNTSSGRDNPYLALAEILQEGEVVFTTSGKLDLSTIQRKKAVWDITSLLKTKPDDPEQWKKLVEAMNIDDRIHVDGVSYDIEACKLKAQICGCVSEVIKKPTIANWNQLESALGSRTTLINGKEYNAGMCQSEASILELSEKLEKDQADYDSWSRLEQLLALDQTVVISGKSYNKEACRKESAIMKCVEALNQNSSDNQAWFGLVQNLPEGRSVSIGGVSHTKQDCNRQIKILNYSSKVKSNGQDHASWVELSKLLSDGQSALVNRKSYTRVDCLVKAVEAQINAGGYWQRLSQAMGETKRDFVMVKGKKYTSQDCMIASHCLVLKAMPWKAEEWEGLGKAMSDDGTVTLLNRKFSKTECQRQGVIQSCESAQKLQRKLKVTNIPGSNACWVQLEHWTTLEHLLSAEEFCCLAGKAYTKEMCRKEARIEELITTVVDDRGNYQAWRELSTTMPTNYVLIPVKHQEGIWTTQPFNQNDCEQNAKIGESIATLEQNPKDRSAWENLGGYLKIGTSVTINGKKYTPNDCYRMAANLRDEEG